MSSFFQGQLGSEFGHILLGLLQAIKRGTKLFVVTSIVYQQKILSPGVAGNGRAPGVVFVKF